MAKRFAFRLQRVLDYRRLLEETRKKELFLVRREIYENNEHLLRLLQEEFRAKEDLKSMRQHELDVQAIRMVMAYAGVLARKIEVATARLRELLEREVQKRKEYIEARKAVRALEIVKDRNFDRYRYEQNREEIRDLDEVGQNQFMRSEH